MAIQAVDFKIADLEQTVDGLPPDQGADLESLLFAYENAAEALKVAYAKALSGASNLPPYEKLVRG